MKYEFENLEVSFDGTQKQADALKERAEALGYYLDADYLCYEKNICFITFYKDGGYAFWPDQYDFYPKQTYNEFMKRTEKYINAPTPKPYPCQAHDDQTHIVKIDGENWRVELIEKVIEPLNAWQWFSLHDVNGGTADWMQAYSDYRLEFYKKHGI